MKNILQKKLNVEKWNASKIAMQDLSGKMDWCKKCPYKADSTVPDFINGNEIYCKAEQSERDELSLCGKAWNKAHRGIKCN